METVNSILLIVQVLLSISLVVLILLQHGKGADAGAAFGSGASATIFGARGSGNFLSRSTASVAILFFIGCLSLAYLSSNREMPDSVTGSVTSQSPSIELPAGDDVPPADDSAAETPVESDLPPAE